jgi:hypothetical protein
LHPCFYQIDATEIKAVAEVTAERQNWVCQSDAAPFPTLRKTADQGPMANRNK